MKILVIGAGKMGSAAAQFLASFPEVSAIRVVDHNQANLTALEKIIRATGKGFESVSLDIANAAKSGELGKAMDGCAAALNALPNRHVSYLSLEAGINAGTPMVDILEEYHRRPDKHEIENLEVPSGMSLDEYGESLYQKALAKDLTVMSGMGFAPGLSNITTAHAMKHFKGAVKAVARVGGIPAPMHRGKYPLQYTVTWSFNHVLREYMVKVPVLKDNEIIEVESLTEHEEFLFTEFGQNADLECAITPGMPSFIYTLRDRLTDFSEKTVRWNGHYAGVQTLKDCGLLDLKPVEIEGSCVVPRELLFNVLNTRLRRKEGDHDACVMYNTVEGVTHDGKRGRAEIFMWDEEPSSPFSAMARVTALPAAAAVALVGLGEIKCPGVVAPEEAYDENAYHHLLKMLETHNVRIIERLSVDEPLV
ncbi:MAG: saccharopine dehydrogenase NADP-binding domain-containing protein [Armatimonadetes bacterium]|nr:saccharopine dehydrogenase NADP-binding domain-containing protein [Armatimonadota bacterium]